MKRRAVLVALAAVLAAAGPAAAGPIVAVDLGMIGVGSLVAGPTISNVLELFPSAGSIDGTLENSVYFDSVTGVYTYVHELTPSKASVSELNTQFPVSGFNGVAGWLFSSTTLTFSIELDPDLTLDWSTLGTWAAGDDVTFFFQSTVPPGVGSYAVIDGFVGVGESYAPVPEPGTLLLLGSGISALALRRRRKS
jgi:hypothetical protein